MFTTRPEILGTFGVVTSTHWLASAAGMAMLERGGNAFDAAVAAGFVLQVVEPHLVGPSGEVPIILHSARSGKTEVLCGQGVTPEAATLDAYKALGLDLVPGSGLLATVVPGAFDAWMLLLRDHGSMKLRDVMEPAIHYARHGHPLLPRVANTIKDNAEFFAKEWPTSSATWLPGGKAPEAKKLFCNPVLADTYQRIVDEAEAAGGNREAAIDKARDAFYRGFVAEAIDRFCRETEAMDTSGRRHKGLLTGDDMARWSATYETPLTYDYHGWRVAKTGPWGQGPVFLQTLALLKELDVAAMKPDGADLIHTVTEAMKLAFADREVYYGDPNFIDVPLETLLSDAYAAQRRALIGVNASLELRPGTVPGFEAQLKTAMSQVRYTGASGNAAPGAGEPTMAHLRTEKRGDTVHIDVIDRWGNMISATPSGGWLQSSPVVPELGFALNTRAQMFWLEPGLPTSMAPRKRPRTTLTPSLALFEGKPRMVFGTPGGDQQDQWQLALFLRRVHHGLNLQEGIDLPLFHTMHFPSSFYPREAVPGRLVVEESFGHETIETLKARGHDVEIVPQWSVGRLTAAEREPDGILRAAATPRLMQAYAIGR
ncbi:gamma-glutamyltranspeptidase / glutathione hydrolase [Mesorhizobium albiziae]|uniref:Gamma-glutamyltranspeptidase / glutathione hydrolase n=1 Tax=Neomesorhizobium albiziae TaxID=335020 RepID=A0A1I3VPZ9_9HYPH|nr:gamma-glutamyltransferase family protein [Mesorhizobium albiziae]GLS29102.1 gamma-glutamyltranspeptidase [Mesorhizobium albiziae]SFJ97325.1 gamma-glutamyltranspeptidase / glutathione hydrolase [Mesorhizobium albiziae]